MKPPRVPPSEAGADAAVQHPGRVSRAETSLRWLFALLLACVVGHGVYRATQLRIEYYDGYDYLRNARALAGDALSEYQSARPPFVSLVQLPAMAIVNASPPAAPVRLIAPHLTSAIVSLLSAGAVLGLFARRFDPTLAWLGALLFVTTRYFVHYAPHAMADIPSAGWAAAATALYLRARERRSLSAWTWCGVALGAGILTKFPLAVLGPSWALAELWRTAVTRRIDAGAWLGIAVAGLVCSATFLAVETLVLVAIHGADGPALLAPTLLEFTTMSDLGARPDESWRDYGAMSRAMLSLPTLLLCGAGILLAGLQRDERDAIPFASLVALGGTTIFVLGHTEARYLLPAVPFILYFALRALEPATGVLRAHWKDWGRLGRGVALLLGAALLAVPLGIGVHQWLLDEDPVYFADAERLAAEKLLAARRGDGRLLWSGYRQLLLTHWAGRVPHDEYLGIFHYPPFAVSYFIDARIDPIAAPPGARLGQALDPASVLEDGDAVLRLTAGDTDARLLPAAGAPPMEILAASRLRFRASGDGEYVAVANPDSRLTLRSDGGQATLSASAVSGSWQVTWLRASDAAEVRAGMVELAPGVAAPLAIAPSEPPLALELFRIERSSIE